MDELDLDQYRRNKPIAEDELSQYARNKAISSPQEEKQGFSGVYSDLKDVIQNLKPSLNAALAKAPHAVAQFGQQALSLPYENLKFIGKTATEGYKPENIPKLSANLFKGLFEGLNVPSEIVDYAGKKGFIPKDLGHYIRGEVPDVGLKPEEENSIAQAIPFFGRTGVHAIEAVHPTMHLRNARRLANRREVGGLVVPEEIFNEAQQFLPDNLPTQNLLEAARSGNYDPLFTLQSDLARSGRQLTRSFSGADRLHGFQANALRQRLLENIRNGLTESGHGDIAELMRRGQGNYRRYQRIIKPAVAIGAGIAGFSNPLQKLLSTLTSE